MVLFFGIVPLRDPKIEFHGDVLITRGFLVMSTPEFGLVLKFAPRLTATWAASVDMAY